MHVNRYRRRRGRGCGVVFWVGLLLNAALIVWTVRGGRLTELLRRPLPAVAAAEQALAAGDLDRVVEVTQAALIEDPTATAVLPLLARGLVYRSYADYDTAPDRAAALEISADWARRAPTNADALAAHAFSLQANDRPVTAAEVAQQALALDEQHALARGALVFALLSTGPAELALREAEAAQPIDDIDGYRALAASYTALDNIPAALAALDDAISLNDKVAVLHYERAALTDPETARASYLAVLAVDETNVLARVRLCALDEREGQHTAALASCEGATDLAPAWAPGWYQLGYTHYRHGDFAEAQANFHRCTTLQTMQSTAPEDLIFECWYLQGQAAEALGDCDALIETYTEFQGLAANFTQTWTYPPEGPPTC